MNFDHHMELGSVRVNTFHGDVAYNLAGGEIANVGVKMTVVERILPWGNLISHSDLSLSQ